MEAAHGRVAFLDGMRISREHLDHLQAYLHLAVVQLRASIGEGKVAYGLKAELEGADLKVAPGLALDAFARPLALDEARTLPVPPAPGIRHVVIAHDLHYGEFFKGFPTVISDRIKLELRPAAPPYADGAVRFAELRPAPPPAAGPAPAPNLLVVQHGDWYLPPLDHGHSGRFIPDADNRMRYDGHPLGLPGAMYDSGFIVIPPGGTVYLKHGLRGRDFVAMLEASSEHGLITSRGNGRDYWYTLPADGEATISRTRHKEYTRFRLRLWPFGAPGAAPQGPVFPVANAGEDRIVEYGEAFRLDGAQSRSPAGLPLRKFKWIQLS